MLLTRILTAVVVLVVLILVAGWAPPAVFHGLLLFILAAAVYEWLLLLGVLPRQAMLVSAAFVAMGLAAWITSPVLVQIIAGQGQDLLPVYGVVSLFWLLLAPFALQRFTPLGEKRLAGKLYALFLLFTVWLALLQADGLGKMFLLSVLLIVWVADTAAYFSGRAFGRHKLAPSISPGKTWEGVIGAIAANLVLAIVMVLWVPQGDQAAQQASDFLNTGNVFFLFQQALGWIPMLLIVTLLTFLSVMGDLYESMLKRLAGVKDSGRLLPGHGGVLDRIDAVIPVFPVTMMLVSLIQSGAVR